MDELKFKLEGAAGAIHDATLELNELVAMAKTGNPAAAFNNKYHEAVSGGVGPAFAQAKAWFGLVRPADNSPYGNVSATIGDVLNGRAGFAANVQQNTSPYGTAARAFVNIAILDTVVAELQRDRTTDSNLFDGMIANNISIGSDQFERPVIDYRTANGPEQAMASRVAQGAEPPKMAFFKTSDRIYRIGAWNIGMEWSEQALKATTLDYVSLTMSHYLQTERDERVYTYIAELFNGNRDMIAGAVPVVESSTLDVASTGGVLTHKAWLKFLARNRRYRRITHVIMDLDTYLLVEGRQGRPGTNNYDPSLARIDPQAIAMNVGFGNDVKVFLVDSAAEGGPVPAGTIYAIDASVAITRVTNTAAAYQAVEEFAMKRTTAMRMDWAEDVFRTVGDQDLRPFDAMHITGA